MSADKPPSTSHEHEEFAREAGAARTNLVVEFWDFLKHNKKWWMLPILIVMALIAALLLLASNPVTAPFTYPVF